MKFFWGHPFNYINITNICYDKLLNNNNIIINKSEDFKINLFGDPMPGLIKNIKVIDKIGNERIFNGNDEDIIIDINNFFKKQPIIYFNDYNITDICFKKCKKNNIINIPKEEELRISLFGDPYPGIIKNIKVKDIFGNYRIYLENTEIIIDNI